MAERNSSKRGSRRNTPQPATGRAGVRNTRATRSQSHDISENEAPQAIDDSQRNVDSADLEGGDGGNGVRAKGRRRTTPHESDLSTVREHPVIATEAQSGGGDAAIDDDQDQSPPPEAKSHGRTSGISGTTARTSGSAQDLIELASEDLSVLDALPDLLESAEKFLNGVVPAEISTKTLTRIQSQLQDKRSGLPRLEQRFRADLEACLPDQSQFFLDISRALPLLYSKETDGELLKHKPDPVFHAANLASLAHNLLLYPHQSSGHFLEQLDISFPKLFTNDGSGTLDLQLETRTQYAIMQLTSHVGKANFDHDSILNQVFYDDDGVTLRALSYMDGRSKESKTARKSIITRVQNIENLWEGNDLPSSIESLRSSYSWDKYVEQMMVWIRGSNENINAQLDKVKLGGIVQSLKTAIEVMRQRKQVPSGDANVNLNSGDIDLSGYVAPLEDVDVTVQPEEAQPQSKTIERELTGSGSLSMDLPRLKQGARSMKRLNNKHVLPSTASQANSREQQSLPRDESRGNSTTKPASTIGTPHQRTANHAPSPAPANFQSVSFAPEGDRSDIVGVWMPQEDDDRWHKDNEDDEEEAFQTQKIADDVLQSKRRHQAQSNAIDQAEPSQAQVKKSMTDRQLGAVKVAWEESQLSQDVGFQQPHHQPIAHRQARQPPSKRNAPEPLAVIDRSPPKRTRFRDTSLDDEDGENRPPQPAPRPSQTYNVANVAAKQMMAMIKAPQTRKPWSEDENDTLIDLIETFGTSWALLKKEDVDDVLQNRDQVALKDKARNMKFDFLKASKRLPRNFDKVIISKSMDNKLREMGIMYDSVTGNRVDAED